MRIPRRHKSVGFTQIELIVVVAVGAVAIAMLSVAVARAISNARHTRSGAALDGFGDALISWGLTNHGRYPLPSAIDLADATVADVGRAKDTSANIASILVWEQLIIPELLVDPNDRGRVSAMSGYSSWNPASAARPADALWDPALSADFTSAQGGNLSWAMRQPAGGRLAHWQGQLTASLPIVSSRGAEMAGIGGTPTKPRADWANRRSIHLRRGEWEGNVAFGDGHVDFMQSPFVHDSVVVNGVLLPPDAMFFDEPTDPDAKNDYLGVFTRAGASPADFRAIWD